MNCVGHAMQPEHAPPGAVAPIDMGTERGKLHRGSVCSVADGRSGPEGCMDVQDGLARGLGSHWKKARHCLDDRAQRAFVCR